MREDTLTYDWYTQLPKTIQAMLRLGASKQFDTSIHRRVFGQEPGADVPAYTNNVLPAWKVVEQMCQREESSRGAFSWRGPLYKSSSSQEHTPGFEVGTSCWYVAVHVAGRRVAIAAESAPLAVCRAALYCLYKRPDWDMTKVTPVEPGAVEPAG